MMRIGWIGLLAFLMSSGPALAVPVAGGFGFVLGVAFDPAQSVSTGESVSGDTYYLVEAPQPEEALDRYSLHITATSQRIAVIFGAKSHPDRGACEAMRNVHRIRFSARFGAPFRSKGLDDVMTFGQTPRFALLECKGDEEPVVFQVSFVDVELMRQYQRERDAQADVVQ